MERFLAYGIDVNLIVEEEEPVADKDRYPPERLPYIFRKPAGTSEIITIKTTALAIAVCFRRYKVVEFLSNMPGVYFISKDVALNSSISCLD
jgi:hypothetical protein